ISISLTQKKKNKDQTISEVFMSCIKTTQVVKTVTREVQEKSTCIDFLTKRICKDVATNELDKMLSQTGSPTRCTKCSKMVSELTRGWKEMEKEKKVCGHNQKIHCSQVSSGFLITDKIKCGILILLLFFRTKSDKHYNLHARWQNWASENTINQKLNPFSEDFAYEYSMSTLLRKGEEERARRAEAYIPQEIDDMCFIIRTMADLDPDGYTRVTFGDLFDRYVRISYKVVGILMRARKGLMGSLWQWCYIAP
uniref:Actin binding Rho activating protein b n=1 Tax=Cyprinus carpio TaxID=7962 RepID=A0A8C1SIN5_CYPCA